MMNKLLAIYLCALLVFISTVLLLAFPALLVAIYMTKGFSGPFIAILITNIITEPLAITGSYILLTSIKDVYNELRMLW